MGSDDVSEGPPNVSEASRTVLVKTGLPVSAALPSGEGVESVSLMLNCEVAAAEFSRYFVSKYAPASFKGVISKRAQTPTISAMLLFFHLELSRSST